MLQKAGYDVEAVAFERRSHPGRMPSCPIQVVGTLERGRYLQRVGCILRALPSVRRAIESHDLVFANGVDMALLCRLAGMGLGRPVVMEIGDIRELQTAMNWKGRVLRKLDKAIADSCGMLVATAPEFIDTYYRKWVGTTTPALVIENKLDIDSWPEKIAPTLSGMPAAAVASENKIRIGYFGVLRWVDSWKTLIALARALPDKVEVVIAGQIAVAPELFDETRIYPNIKYLGEYRSPDDLPRLFGSIDLVWAVYPEIGPADWNLRWARTNRFYEACFFRRPVVARRGSKDAEEIRRFSIGMIIGSGDEPSIVQRFSELTIDQVREWQANIRLLPPSTYLYTEEVEDLGRALRSVLLGVN